MNLLITGGTGSFGRAFTKLMIDRCERLVIYSRDEWKQGEMRDEFPESRFPQIRYFIGDVRDRERLETALYGIDTVVHAAALKQVPVAEYNPFECIRTNVYGAENVAKAAIACGIKRVVALSTDKAVAPINLYGASKLAAEKIFVAADKAARGCHFAVVRYGNVIGSRGSVIPYWQKLIAEGAKTLPLTHRDMTRFWITLKDGAKFVEKCLIHTEGGEIFVPALLSARMTDVAQVLAPGMPLKITGMRPGEKIHEWLISPDEQNVCWAGDHFVIDTGSKHRLPPDKGHGLSSAGSPISLDSLTSLLASLGVRPASPAPAVPLRATDARP